MDSKKFNFMENLNKELITSLKEALFLLEEANLPDELLETQCNFCANTFNLINRAENSK